MKKLFALLIALLFFALPAFAQYDFPSTPTLDQVVTGPGGQQFKWDGVKWVALFAPAGGGGGLTFVGPTPPPSPPVGQLWFDTTNVQTYLWYNDGTSSQWVAIVNIGGGGGGNFLPIDNPVFTNTMQGTVGGTPFVALSTAVNQAAPLQGVLSLVATQANTTNGAFPSVNMIVGTANGNWQVGGTIINTSTATGTVAEDWALSNDANEYAAIQLTNTGWNVGGPLTHNEFGLMTSAANGIAINSAGGGPIHFWTGNESMRITPPAMLAAATPPAAPWGSIVNIVSTQATQSSGAAAGMLGITANGVWNTAMGISNNSAAPGNAFGPQENYYLSNDAGEYAALGLYNTGFSPGGPVHHNQAYVGTDAADGLVLNSAGSTGLISFWGSGAQLGFVGPNNPFPVYSSGTWVPVLSFNSSTAGITYANRTGNYILIGHLVHAEFAINLTSKGPNNGASLIGNFPFNQAGNGTSGWGDCWYGNMTGTSSNFSQWMVNLAPNVNYAGIFSQQLLNPVGGVQIGWDQWTDTSGLNCSLDYIAQ